MISSRASAPVTRGRSRRSSVSTAGGCSRWPGASSPTSRTRDVVQDALLAAFRAIGSFDGRAELSTWLHRVVVNAALMKLRSRRRLREEPIDDLLPRFHEDGHRVADGSGRESASDAVLERAETRARVRRAIARLPETYRTVLVLRDIEERETAETAALLGITPQAVKTRLHRARQVLRTLLAREPA